MRQDIDSHIETMFKEGRDNILSSYDSCSAWLTDMVENYFYIAFLDFFDVEEFKEGNEDELQQEAIDWIEENANEIVDFDIARIKL